MVLAIIVNAVLWMNVFCRGLGNHSVPLSSQKLHVFSINCHLLSSMLRYLKFLHLNECIDWTELSTGLKCVNEGRQAKCVTQTESGGLWP